ncbi:MAG: tape measure protein [Lysobacteraceae bacterium]
MADQTVTLRITANTQGLVTGVELAKRETRSLGDEGQSAGQKLGSGVASARAEIERTGTVINQVKGFVGGLAAAFVSFQSVKALASMADEWSDLTSLVKVNIGATEDANAVMERLTQVARGTYSSLRDTAQSFAANATTLNALGKSTQEQLEYTTALNNALVISGAKGEQFAQVQDALSKAMATGALRGEELNTVLGRGSAVAEALADELGASVLKLRQLGADGKITGDVIFTALVRRMGELEERAESMPATIGDAFTVLRNALLSTVGYADNAASATNGIAEAIIDLADVISRPEVKEGFAAVAIGAVNAAAEVAKLFGEVKKVADFAGRLAGMKLTGWLDPDDLELGRMRFRELSDELIRLQNGERSWAAVTEKQRQARIAYLKEEIATLQENAKAAIIYQGQVTAAAEDAENAAKKSAEEAERQRQASLDALRALVTGSGDAEKATRGLAAAQAAAQARLDAYAKRQSDNARAAHDFREAMRSLAAELSGPLAQAELEHQKRLDELQELLFLGVIGHADAAAALELYEEQLRRTTEEFDGTAESARELESILSQFDDIGMSGLVRDIRLVEEALERGADAAGKAFSEEQIERMKAAVRALKEIEEERNIELMQQGVSSLQAMAKEGTAAYTALGIAQDILAYKAAVTAIANQGGGDPYTAFARIAAMIGTMASIGLRVGGHATSIGGSAAQRQATQGTGTVLGDASAKSESIARAVEITASATQQLVGINRGMLHALQNMAAGLSGASTLLARGAGNLEFDALTVQHNAFNRIFSPSVMGLLGSAMESITTTILGARNKITDTGILIGGGLLSELLQGITVGAYQENQSRSWWFGSTRTSEQVQDLGDDVAVQFQLVLDSIADAVRAGAEALGLDMQAVNAAIAAFEIEEIRISTMDLSAEEAQAELEAVFSAIFDDLAGHVVPFVAQFQRVGEGLGETLVRVATSVQVTQEAVRQLGISLDEADPERLAQISVGLVDLMGGVEEFIAGMTGFVSAFAPESHKFSVAQDALTRAFAQFGLEIPTSRDAMWELMQSLDATTASGREQIAMLLQLADVSDSYYTMLEDRASRMAAIDASIADGAWQQYLDGLTDSQRAIAETTRYYDDWRDSLIASGATVEQLAAVEEQRAVAMARNYATQAEALARAEASYVDFVTGIWRETVQLSDYQSAMMDADSWRTSAIATAHEHARAAGMAGASEQALALIELRASQLRAQALAQLREETQSLVDQLYGARGNDIGSAFTSGLESASNAAADYWESQRRSAETLQQYLDSMLLGDLSALTPAEQLAEAWSQLNDAVAGGDADAATRLADVYLRLLRGHEASGEDYNAGFWSVRELLQGMLDNIGPIPDAVPAGADGSGYITAAGAEQIAAQNRLDLAVQLAQHLDDLAGAVGQTVWELMDSMGVDLRQLTADLGISLQSITGETVLALVNMADLLGTDLLTLTGQLGVSLTDMGAGIRELAEQTGANLDALTVESVQALGGLANQLGIDLADIATSVGADLGSLADSQSLLNQALQGEIDKLPDDQARALQEYFDNIVAATSEADANEAIDTMAGYINSLDADIREELAPYFDKVFPAKALTDLGYLTQIASHGAAQLAAAQATNGLLARIADNAMAANNAAGIPSYAVGTYNVPATGPAILHAGEMVLPRPMADAMRQGAFGGGGDTQALETRLDAVIARLDRIDKTTAQGAQAVSQTIVTTGATSDRNADASRARHAQAQRRGVTA